MYMSDFNKLLLASQFLEPSIFTKDGFLIFDKLIDLDDQNPTKIKLLDSNELAKDEIDSNPSNLSFFSMRIRSDKELALKAINGDWLDGNLLSVLGNNLKSDYDVVLAAVKKQGCQLQHADISLRGNISIALAALHSCSVADTYIPYHTDMHLIAAITVLLFAKRKTKKCKSCCIPF